MNGDDRTEFTEPLNPLPAEDRAHAEAAQHGRTRFARTPVGALASELRKALPEYLGARAAGMTREQAVQGFEGILRELWQKPVTKFPPDCAACDDTGRRVVVCTDQMRCGRRVCAQAHPAFEHEYVVACDCTRGIRLRPAPPASSDEQLAAVGQTKPQSATPRRFNFRRGK